MFGLIPLIFLFEKLFRKNKQSSMKISSLYLFLRKHDYRTNSFTFHGSQILEQFAQCLLKTANPHIFHFYNRGFFIERIAIKQRTCKFVIIKKQHSIQVSLFNELFFRLAKKKKKHRQIVSVACFPARLVHIRIFPGAM